MNDDQKRRENAARMRAYRAKYPEASRAYSRHWHETNRERVKRNQRAWRARNWKKVAGYRAKKYGISQEEYTHLADAPCDICGKRNIEPSHIDHDHTSGKIRGALCEKCNLGVGLFGDDPERLERAAKYLRRH